MPSTCSHTFNKGTILNTNWSHFSTTYTFIVNNHKRNNKCIHKIPRQHDIADRRGMDFGQLFLSYTRKDVFQHILSIEIPMYRVFFPFTSLLVLLLLLCFIYSILDVYGQFVLVNLDSWNIFFLFFFGVISLKHFCM